MLCGNLIKHKLFKKYATCKHKIEITKVLKLDFDTGTFSKTESILRPLSCQLIFCFRSEYSQIKFQLH